VDSRRSDKGGYRGMLKEANSGVFIGMDLLKQELAIFKFTVV
jgi:hypothetical protein